MEVIKKKNTWQIISISGMIGVVAYILHVIIGGLLWKGYSHITQTISELTGSGSPNAAFLTVFTTVYGILLIVFSVSAYFNLKALKVKRLAMVGVVLLFIMELTSFVGYSLFPLDMGGALDNFQNTMHLIVSGIVVICTLGSGYCIGIGLWKTEGHKKIGIFIFICSLIITIFGALTPIAMANNLPFAGLTERINIFTLQAWILVLSVYLFRKRMYTLK